MPRPGPWIAATPCGGGARPPASSGTPQCKSTPQAQPDARMAYGLSSAARVIQPVSRMDAAHSSVADAEELQCLDPLGNIDQVRQQQQNGTQEAHHHHHQPRPRRWRQQPPQPPFSGGLVAGRRQLLLQGKGVRPPPPPHSITCSMLQHSHLHQERGTPSTSVF